MVRLAADTSDSSFSKYFGPVLGLTQHRILLVSVALSPKVKGQQHGF
jgi:hypothetical protein